MLRISSQKFSTSICLGVIIVMLIYLYIIRKKCTDVNSQLPNIATNAMIIPGRKLLGFQSYSQLTKNRLRSLLKRNASATDPELIDFVRTVIDTPSTSDMIKMSRPLVKTPQAEEIDNTLKMKKSGFFVEAGALDGERSSNTIFFEIKRNWRGLLVEPDPYFYTQLIGRNRKSWSINACISPYHHVSEIPFVGSGGGQGKLSISSSIGQNLVPCFPFETLMSAMNVTQVDFFSLDIEGFEMPILRTIPFDKIRILTLAVEYGHGKKDEYVTFMESKGYVMTREIHFVQAIISLYVEDFIFVYNQTSSLAPV